MSADNLDADVARVMAMSETEVDAELRAMGMDPAESAEKGRQAVAGALLEVRTFKAAGASLDLSQTVGKLGTEEWLLRLTVAHASFGICQPREFAEAMSLKFAFRRALLTLLNAAREPDWQPIDSAPEDELILVATEGGYVDTAHWTGDEDTGARKWWWCAGTQQLHENLTPTHWMPMPKHPAA